jgi:hypothetical protein
MSKKNLSILLIVVGVIIMLVTLFAGNLGLSTNMAITWKKLLGAAVGLIVAVVGIVLATRKEIKPVVSKKTRK